jgi:hypothetical protein
MVDQFFSRKISEIRVFQVNNLQNYSLLQKAQNCLSQRLKSKITYFVFFQLPISGQAYEQYLELHVVCEQIDLSTVKDRWRYIWDSDSYSTKKAYRHLMGQTQVHSIYKCLWKSKCQPKHKVFYWLWLKNRLTTRNMLRRKNMTLESYSCENCLWQGKRLFITCFSDAISQKPAGIQLA